jgi:hypothetical protein
VYQIEYHADSITPDSLRSGGKGGERAEAAAGRDGNRQEGQKREREKKASALPSQHYN